MLHATGRSVNSRAKKERRFRRLTPPAICPLWHSAQLGSEYSESTWKKSKPFGLTFSSSSPAPWATMRWQALQSLPLIELLPSAAMCLPSWQRKQPLESLWPMKFGMGAPVGLHLGEEVVLIDGLAPRRSGRPRACHPDIRRAANSSIFCWASSRVA